MFVTNKIQRCLDLLKVGTWYHSRWPMYLKCTANGNLIGRAFRARCEVAILFWILFFVKKVGIVFHLTDEKIKSYCLFVYSMYSILIVYALIEFSKIKHTIHSEYNYRGTLRCVHISSYIWLTGCHPDIYHL